MCISLRQIWIARGPSGEWQTVACGQCWSCRYNRINDYVGRALCEADSSSAICSLTLTYRDQDDLSHKIITSRHFQNFIRALRKRGHSVRYLGAGEYGERKGRAHFHAVLFFQGHPPEMPHKVNFHIDEWPHGHLYADWSVSDKSVRYVCKYLQKQDGDQRWFTLSKKPVLGWDFFERKAHFLAPQGVMPTSFLYLPPAGNEGRMYYMTGATRRQYVARVAELLAISPAGETRVDPWVMKALEGARKILRLRDFDANARAIVQHAREALWDGSDPSITDILAFIDKNHPSYTRFHRNYTDLEIHNQSRLLTDDWE